MSGTRTSDAAIGFTVKSGWAAAVLLSGSISSPIVVDSRRIELSDPEIPDSRQPYHDGFGTARRDGPELARLVASVEQFGRQSVTGLIQDHRMAGYAVRGAAIVVGSLNDPERIANDHIRIHALEGRLFRRAVEEGATASGLHCSLCRDRDLCGLAADILERPETALRSAVTALGRRVGGGWRAEQKAAALAAWLLLAGWSENA